MKKVSMQDIATELGISRMTVSKCFKNSEDISEETKQAIWEKAEEMGYEYHNRAKYQIAVLFSEVYFEPNEKFYSELYKRLTELERSSSMKFSLIYIDREDEKKLYLNPSVLEKDAVMLLGQFSKKFVVSIMDRKLPVVCLDFMCRGMEVDSVVSSSYRASYELTSYLLELGHKKVAFVGNLNYTNSVNDRYLGYYKALLEENIPVQPAYRIDDRDEKGIMEEFSLPDNMPTAFVCNNDHTAYLLTKELKQQGYRIPEDISVTGFDDVLYAEIADPPITSVHVKRKFMAEQAVNLMERRLKMPDASARTVTIDCSIVCRDSVAAPAEAEKGKIKA
ncbi:MAG: LacI family DNA-binding transcriptional regulator [Lachnospiraceae bacterium]|nr:LacI family DNA-binding transcriptional regulator [Lachnospiraceae bacterium]